MAEQDAALRRAEHRGYEPSDVNIRAVVGVAALLAGFAALGALLLGGLLGLFEAAQPPPAGSALERTESRGSHYRRDFPDTAREAVAVLAGYEDGAGPKVWTEPVRYTRLPPDTGRMAATVDVGD